MAVRNVPIPLDKVLKPISHLEETMERIAEAIRAYGVDMRHPIDRVAHSAESVAQSAQQIANAFTSIASSLARIASRS